MGSSLTNKIQIDRNQPSSTSGCYTVRTRGPYISPVSHSCQLISTSPTDQKFREFDTREKALERGQRMLSMIYGKIPEYEGSGTLSAGPDYYHIARGMYMRLLYPRNQFQQPRH